MLKPITCKTGMTENRHKPKKGKRVGKMKKAPLNAARPAMPQIPADVPVDMEQVKRGLW